MNSNGSETQNKVQDTESLENYILAMGLSSCRNSYRDHRSDECYNYYLSKAPSEIAKIWKFLGTEVQTDYIKKNIGIVFNFLLTQEKTQNQ